MIPGPNQRAWFRALDHARLLGVKPCWRVGDYYTVDSPRSGQRYTVRRHRLEGHVTYSCDCTAAASGNVCWHKALVASLPYERWVRDQARVVDSWYRGEPDWSRAYAERTR